MADTLMLGFVSQTAMASNSLAGQIHFILNMFYSGLAAGTTMLAAQYWGRQNMKAIEHILAIGVKLAAAVGGAVLCGHGVLPRPADAHLHQRPLHDRGRRGLFANCGLVLPVHGALSPLFEHFKKRREGKDKHPDKLLRAAHQCGFKRHLHLRVDSRRGAHGHPGRALATVISRIGEFLLCLAYGQKFQVLRLRPGLFIMFNRVLWRDFIRYSLPALGNECVFAVGSSMYSVIMGRLGEDLVAANSIMASLRSVATVLGFGVANGTAILLGKAIGAGDMARAERDAKRLLGLTFLASLLGSAVVLAAYPIITHTMTTLSEQALSYFGIMTAISVVYVWGPPMNTAGCAACSARGATPSLAYSGRHLHVGGYGAPGAALRFCAEAAAHVGCTSF